MESFNDLINLETSAFEDESKYFRSVSVDLNSHELKKVQFYKNIINHLIERAESS